MKTYKLTSFIVFPFIFLASHTYCMQNSTREHSLIELIRAKDFEGVQKKVETDKTVVNQTEKVFIQYESGFYTGSIVPLVEAAKTDNIKITQYLLENGANINTVANDYRPATDDHVIKTAFQAAVKQHNLPMMQLLVQYGVDVKEEDNKAQLLLYACIKHRMLSCNSSQKITLEKTIHQLLEWNCNLSLQDSDSNKGTPFETFSVGVHANSPKHTLQLLVAFLSRGAHRIADNHAITPLMTACKYDNDFLVKIFLQNGAPLEAQNKGGKTALFYTAENSNRNAFQELLMHGANVHHVDKEGNTVVHKLLQGCRWNLDRQMRFLLPLLDRHININAQNNDGDTPLHVAMKSQCGCEWIIPLLFFYGAEQSLFIKNKKNETPIDLIYKREYGTYGLHMLDLHWTKKTYTDFEGTEQKYAAPKINGRNPVTGKEEECHTFADYERTLLLHNCYLLSLIEYAKETAIRKHNNPLVQEIKQLETENAEQAKEQVEQLKKQLKKRNNIYRRVRDREIGKKMPQRLYIQ